MKKQAIIIGGIVIVAISSMSGAALSFLKDDQWSNYTQSWKTPMEIRSKRRTIAEQNFLRYNDKDSMSRQIKKR